jgi:hypothetical protein
LSSLNDKHGVFPTTDGRVALLFGGVVEVYERPAALAMLGYVHSRYDDALAAHEANLESATFVQICRERVMAWETALAAKR